MIFFEEALLRLKQQLRVQTDKEVADLLGMKPTAFNERKKRGAFPEDKLLALVARRPDLVIDPEWVLHGTTAAGRAGGVADGYGSLVTRSLSDARDPASLTLDELELVALFRQATLERKAEAVAILRGGQRKR